MTDCGTLIHTDGGGGRVATIESGAAVGMGSRSVYENEEESVEKQHTGSAGRTHARHARTPTQTRAHTHDSLAH